MTIRSFWLAPLLLTAVISPPPLLAYQDPARPMEERVADLLGRMTQEEKIGQLVLVEKNSVHEIDDIARYGFGAMLSGGGGKPEPNTPEAWRAMIETFQLSARNSRLGIPLLYGVDAVHGHANVPGATVVPQAIGLAATRNPELVRRIGVLTAQELLSTGANWNFGPGLDVATDTRWGRTYETFGSDSELVGTLGAAYIEGLQSYSDGGQRVLATAKHFVGTGAMQWGTSTNPDFYMDQGVIPLDEVTLRSIHLPPFREAIEAGVMSIMVGHASWNGSEIVANHDFLTNVLKGELGFQGFVVSDWNGVAEIPGTEAQGVVTAINAGVDMVMLPYDYKGFVAHMEAALRDGSISSERLDDAVTRILRAKFLAGLFDVTTSSPVVRREMGSWAHQALAREAVSESVVVLKNTDATLPLSPTVSRVLVAGSAASNVGRQAGGWTVEWQGVDGNSIAGTTMLEAIQQTVQAETDVRYDLNGRFPSSIRLADVGIVVVGEQPYAEGWGDAVDPRLTSSDLETIERVRLVSRRLVVVVVSGRPLPLHPFDATWDAVLAVWLPGTHGEGVTDVLFGLKPFTGTLPVPWP